MERDTGRVRPIDVKRSLILVPVLFAALLVLPATSAWACSCAQMTTAQATGAADVVLLGTLTGTDGPSRLGSVWSSDDPVRYEFSVAEVFKGEAAPTTHVHSAASGASCGIEGLLPGREYVLFTQVKGEQLWVDLCGGSDLAASGFVADVEQITGVGRAPLQAVPGDGRTPLAGQAGVAGGRAWLVPLVGGGVLAIVLAGLLLGVVRRGRRRG